MFNDTRDLMAALQSSGDLLEIKKKFTGISSSAP